MEKLIKNKILCYAFISLFSFSLMLSTSFAMQRHNEGEYPLEVKRKILLYLEAPDLAKASFVSKGWQDAVSDKNLWIPICKKMNIGIFLIEDENSFSLEKAKDLAKKHYLSVLVNTLDNPEKIYRIVHYYGLHRFWEPFFEDMFNHITHFPKLAFSDKKELCAQGNAIMLNIPAGYFSEENGKYLNPERAQIACDINDWLVLQKDEAAIERRIEGSIYGSYGYNNHRGNSKNLIDHFVEEGSHTATIAKIHGCWSRAGRHEEGKQLVELLISHGNTKAMFIKAEGLGHGRYGYRKNIPEALRIIDEIAFTTGNYMAIMTLVTERYNMGVKLRDQYYTSPETKVNFIEKLANKGFSTAIRTKIHGLDGGRYGYEQNKTMAKDFIEHLVTQNNVEGFKYKLEGIGNGTFGYPKVDKEKFVTEMVDKGHPVAIKHTLETLWKGGKEQIEKLEENKNPVGFYFKSLGIKYGLFGFQKDRELAVEYIRKYSIPY